MAENDIKTKIVLEGEKEYRQALKDANRELKTLKSELKAETAELGKNATAQEKNAVKVKNLQKQIAEQEKVVKTYRKALEEVKEKYGDNEEEIAKWEQKLNSARATLANMKNDLDGVGDSMKGMANDASMATVASRSAAESIGSLADIGGAISDSIEGIFTGMLNALRDTIGEVWSLIADTAAKANNWTDLASYYGSTASEIERINKAIEWTQGNFGDFTNLLNQLSWGGKGKKITEWFGVSDVNYDNKLEYAMAVLEKMQELQRTDPGKLGDAMEDVFGQKKSQQVMWFVSNLDQIHKNLQAFDENGYGIGEDGLSTMNDVWFKLGEIEGKFNDLKQRFAAGFGTVTLDVATSVSGALDALSKYFDAETPEEREAAIQEIEKNITDMFTRVRDAIQDGIELIDKLAEDMKGSEDPTVQTIGKLLGGLADAMSWFTENNANNVVTALEILAGFWITGKGLQMAATIAELAANIRTLSFFKLIGGAASGGLGTMGETIGTTAGNSFISVLAANLPEIFAVALLGIPLIDALLHPEKYNGGLTKEQEKTLQGMSDAGIIADPEKSKRALRYLAGVPEEEKADGNVGTLGFTLPTRRTPHGTYVGYDLTDEQRAGLESYWDYLRGGEFYNANLVEGQLNDLFGAETETLNKLMEMIDVLQGQNGWQDLEDLPANWWLHGNDNDDGITNENLSRFNNLPGEMKKAVKEGVSGIRVTLDGRAVGNIVAEYVSEAIAQQIQ